MAQQKSSAQIQTKQGIRDNWKKFALQLFQTVEKYYKDNHYFLSRGEQPAFKDTNIPYKIIQNILKDIISYISHSNKTTQEFKFPKECAGLLASTDKSKIDEYAVVINQAKNDLVSNKTHHTTILEDIMYSLGRRELRFLETLETPAANYSNTSNQTQFAPSINLAPASLSVVGKFGLKVGQWIKFSTDEDSNRFSNEKRKIYQDDQYFLVLSSRTSGVRYILMDGIGTMYDYDPHVNELMQLHTSSLNIIKMEGEKHGNRTEMKFI